MAEAAKMYENVQRDILIALANEYSEYCRLESISISDVTDCASTKWNFSKVNPGLVGGHCISIDPYYLMDRCRKKQFKIPLISQARITNELKPSSVSKRIIELTNSIHEKNGSIRLLLLGFTYKADCSDIRNTKVADVIYELKKVFDHVDCFDPFADKQDAKQIYNINLLDDIPALEEYDLVIRMVDHQAFNKIYNSSALNKSTYLLSLNELL